MKQFRPYGRVVFDYETMGLEVWLGKARPFLLGLEDEKGQVLIARPGTANWAQAMKVLKNPAIEKVGWNVKYDLSVSRYEGIETNGAVHDAMLMCYMNNEYEPNLKLKDVGRRHFGEACDEEIEVKKFLSTTKRKEKREVNYSDLPKELVERYLEKDLDLTLKSLWKFEHVMKGGQRRVYDIERKLIPNVIEIERWGIHIDVKYCKKIMQELRPRKENLVKKLVDLAGINFNIASPTQLSMVLESQGIDTGQRNKRGEMVADSDSLRRFHGRPFIDTLLEWRSIQKVDKTYFENFISNAKDEVIHPSFWPFGQESGGIKTGRFSCTKPAFQTIPGGSRGDNVEVNKDPGLVRRAITPREGYAYIFGDYSQIEYKIFACNVGDEKLLKDLASGMDYHTATALLIFGKNCFDGKSKEDCKRIRYDAKTLNFSFIFGMGSAAYAKSSGLSVREARHRKTKYFNNIPAARKFLIQAQVDLLRDGYVQDQFGRRYHVPKDRCYIAANACCQGPAALVMKRGINRTFNNLKGLDAHPFLTVHDELGIEVRRNQVWDAIHALREGMEDRENFPIPITVDLAVAEVSWAEKRDWGEVKDIWKARKKR